MQNHDKKNHMILILNYDTPMNQLNLSCQEEGLKRRKFQQNL